MPEYRDNENRNAPCKGTRRRFNCLWDESVFAYLNDGDAVWLFWHPFAYPTIADFLSFAYIPVDFREICNLSSIILSSIWLDCLH